MRYLLILVCLLLTNSTGAQQSGAAKARNNRSAYANGITFNFPGIVHIAEFGGWSVGAEYRRLLNAKGTLGASFGVTRLIWAGTQETGEYFSKGYRGNIIANLVAPGFNYYPIGSNDIVSLEIGALVQIGSTRRIDSYQGRGGGYITDIREKAFFFSPQFHAGVSILGNGHLLLTFYGDFGPMLACGERTSGNYGVLGLKIGGRF